MIIALAGRRIDADGAQPARFPLANVPLVRERISSICQSNGATALVSSAACGADLIAQGAAKSLGLHRRIVLPFAPERFRNSSVTDRPGDWGETYDALLAESAATGDVINVEDRIPAGSDDDQAYALVNHTILDEALTLARESGEPAAAVLVWDGVSRGSGDLTEAFGAEARKRGLNVMEVRTF